MQRFEAENLLSNSPEANADGQAVQTGYGKMQRDSMENYYSDYITGELDAALQLSVENHLKNSPEANAEVEALRRTMASLDEMPSVELPSWFHDNVMNRLDMEMANEAAQQKKAGWNWRTLLQPRVFARGAAALAVLCVVGGVGLQAAGLNPLAFLFPKNHRAQVEELNRVTNTVLNTVRAEWRADNGGTAMVHITVPSEVNTSTLTLGYTVTTEGKDLSGTKSGVLLPGQETVVTVACDNPATAGLTVKIDANKETLKSEVPAKSVAPTMTP